MPDRSTTARFEHPQRKRPSWFYRMASPVHFYDLSSPFMPWLWAATGLLFLIGLPWGLAIAPADYQQGDSFRIIYIHVPTAALSMGVYLGMAITAGIGLVWRIKLAHEVARACAPIGMVFTFLALATGSLWGKPMWGTWWVWDARLTSELILLFLYLGYMGLRDAFDDADTGNRAAAVLALIGTVNLPIIHFSVEWWYTLHQGATLFKFGRPAIAGSMLWPLLVMLGAFAVLALTLALARTRNRVLRWQLERQV